MKTRVESADVLYAVGDVVVVGESEIEEIEKIATRSTRGRARLCAHLGPTDALHEMFIVLDRIAYIRPHKHIEKAESVAVIEGLVDVVLFHEDGRIRSVLQLGGPGSGRNFYYRLNSPIYHMLLIRSPKAVFHESTEGPFHREDTVFAPWSPVEMAGDAIRIFCSGLDRKIAMMEKS